jgi:spoIIIJ-associated protein
MNKIRMKGKEVKNALEEAAQTLGKKLEDLEYRVISEGKPGVLGVFGGEEAEVEAWEKISPADESKIVLQEILNYLGLMAVSEIKGQVADDVELNIKGEDLGPVIGKEGATLKALQTIISSMVSHGFGRKIRVYVDAGGYRERQEQALVRLAKEAAGDVEQSGQEKVLPPMSASDRRVIHMALKDMDKIQTFSRGEGEGRRLVIAPK